MKTIPLTRGYAALVDDEDYDWLNQWKWFAQCKPDSDHVYAERWEPMQCGCRRRIKMHRLIIGAPSWQFTDHRNGNTLDNCRANLRTCNARQNAWNRKKPKTNTTGFIGVFRNRNRFQANVYTDGKRYHCGNWPTAEKAASARDKKALELFGNFAVLNFPKG